MKRFCAAISVAAAVCVSAGAALSDVTIRLGHVTQTSHPFHIGAEMFRDAVAAESNGTIEISIYPARQLGDDRQLLEGVRLGTVDAAIISSSTFSLFTPVMDALQLPWLIGSYDELAEAFVSAPARDMLVSLDGLGMTGLGYYEGGFRHFLNNRITVNTVADMKGLRVRVVPNPLHIAIFEAIGAAPTPMAYGEVYTALETGVLDGAEINVSSVYGERFYEAAREFSLTGHFFFPGVLVVNKNLYDRLSPDEQTALAEAARKTIATQVAAAKQQEMDALEELKAASVKVVEFNDVEAARALVQPLVEDYEARDPLVKAFADHVRAAAAN